MFSVVRKENAKPAKQKAPVNNLFNKFILKTFICMVIIPNFKSKTTYFSHLFFWIRITGDGGISEIWLEPSF